MATYNNKKSTWQLPTLPLLNEELMTAKTLDDLQDHEKPDHFILEFEAIAARDSLDPSFHSAFMDLSNFDWKDHPPRKLTSRSDHMPSLSSATGVGREAVVEGTVNPQDVFLCPPLSPRTIRLRFSSRKVDVSSSSGSSWTNTTNHLEIFNRD